MRLSRVLSIAAASAALLFACGKEGEKKDDAAEPEAAPAPTPEELAAAQAALAAADAAAKEPPTELEGVWKSPCIRIDTGLYAIATSTYTGKRQKLDQAFYKTATCLATGWISRQVRTFEIVGDYAAIAGAKKVDLTYRLVQIEMTNDDAVAEANAEAFFGITDWKKGEPRDVSGKPSTAGGEPTDAIGSVFYNIAKVDGTDLLNGDPVSGDGKTDATRPTSLSSSVKLTKQ